MPPINPDIDDIADRAKYGYAVATQVLAETQYRLGELAGTGQLDPKESENLQDNLVHIWEALYGGTVCAVRDWDTDDCTWDEADNTYSDGRQVMIQVRIEPWETSECNWEHNRFTCGDGAVNEHPRGTICHISPVHPEDERIVDPPHPPPSAGFAAWRKWLLEGVMDAGDDDDIKDDETE